MKLKIIFGIVLIMLLQSVSAYTIYNYGSDQAFYRYSDYSGYGHFYLGFDDYSPDPYYSYESKFYYGNDYYSPYNSYRPSYYGRYDYPSYDYRGSYYDRYDERRLKREAAIWVLDSYFQRYDDAAGRESQEVFGGKVKHVSSSDWGYKEAYDPRIHGIGSYDDYYYKPVNDPELGYTNWNY